MEGAEESGQRAKGAEGRGWSADGKWTRKRRGGDAQKDNGGGGGVWRDGLLFIEAVGDGD